MVRELLLNRRISAQVVSSVAISGGGVVGVGVMRLFLAFLLLALQTFALLFDVVTGRRASLRTPVAFRVDLIPGKNRVYRVGLF